jgi:signal transduction histidine kinase
LGDDRAPARSYRQSVRSAFVSLPQSSARGSRPIRSADAAVPIAVAAIQLTLAVLVAHRPHHPVTVTAGAYVLLAAGPLVLLARHRYPAAVLAAVFAIALAYSLLDYRPRGAVFVSLVVAFSVAMLAGRRLLGWLSIVAGYLVFVVLLPLAGAQMWPSLAWATGIAAWMLVLAAGAEIVRGREERAREAARSRSEEERRIAGEERLRVARELHDVLAHNISLINVQAGVALHLADDRPEQARAALEAIKRVSKETLAELRSVLDVLRQPGEGPPREPADGLDRLGELIERMRAAGLPVSADVDREPASLPSGLDLAAYRIVQEALTNVLRHAPGAATKVRVGLEGHELRVRVENEEAAATVYGPAGAANWSEPSGGRYEGDGDERNGFEGNGIPGMRERAAALGGVLHAGPLPGGGFLVDARLPCELGR